MIGSYLAVGFRRLVTQKLYSTLNIAGLAVGLACAILILLYVHYELSFDEHFPGADRIYRISAEVPTGNGGAAMHAAPNFYPAGPQLELDFAADVDQVARIARQSVRLRHGADTFYEDGFRWADASFFDIFALDWVAGDPKRALTEPSTVVLTQGAAAKYFGAENPVGQTLVLEGQWPLTVTGVIRDLPRDTHLSATVIASFDVGDKVLGWNYDGNWSFWFYHTYVRLKPGARIESLERRFPQFVASHRRPGDSAATMIATKLADIHLHGRVQELTPPGSLTTVTAFAAIALSILLIACVNFMNLSTARAAQRAREIGVRKVIGAVRGQLVAQFLGEAVLYALLATLVAVALVEVLLPPFNTFAGTAIELDYGNVGTLATLAVLALAVGLLAGSYPAFYLSAFEPVRVLKGDATRGRGGQRLRGTLVVVQFAVSIVLLIATVTIYLQTRFARDVDRGFDTAQVVHLSGSPTVGLGPGFEAARNRMLENPEITAVIQGGMRPGGAGTRLIRAEGSDPAGRQMLATGVDYGFFETYGIELLAGRTFSRDYGTDGFTLPNQNGVANTPGAYVLNELAARELGFTPDEAIGKWFETDFSGNFSASVRGPIVGVVKNTYFETLREPQKPLVYFAAADSWRLPIVYFRDASIRVTGKRLRETLAFIDATWSQIQPDLPVARTFLDDEFAALYANDERQMQIFGVFAALAIFVACLGLFGLASFTTERRTKEIGIRKTLGGSAVDVVTLLTSEFSRLVLLSNVVAWPIAYLAMRRWLADFAYRIDLSPLVFAGGALVTFAIAWLTVAGIALRAASAKPLHSLRYE